MRRTNSTALIVSVGFMCCYLTGGVDRERTVPLLGIHGVEKTYLVESHDVAEVPADQHINLRDRCKCDMEHIVAETRRKNPVGLVAGNQVQGFGRDRDDLGSR